MGVEALSTEGKSVSVPAELTKEVQGEPRLLQALEQITSLLVPGETIEAWAVQRRFLALTHRRALVAATSGRLIDMERGLFGGFEPRSVRWQDLKEARIAVGVFGASLTVSFFEALIWQSLAKRIPGPSRASEKIKRRRSTACAKHKIKPGGKSGACGS